MDSTQLRTTELGTTSLESTRVSQGELSEIENHAGGRNQEGHRR